MSSVALKRGEVRKRPAARRAPSQPAVRRIAVPISAAVLRRNAIAAFSVLALVAGVVVITLLGLGRGRGEQHLAPARGKGAAARRGARLPDRRAPAACAGSAAARAR